MANPKKLSSISVNGSSCQTTYLESATASSMSFGGQEEMVKHLPFPSTCIVQVLSLVFLPSAIVPFFIKFDWPILALPLTIIIALWTGDLVVFVLSLTVWWNAPIAIGEEGMLRKGTLCPWSPDAVITTKHGPPTRYGPLYERMTVRYPDGKSIRFDLNDPIIKSIRKYCRDETFLAKFDKSL